MTSVSSAFFETVLSTKARDHLKQPGAFVGFILGRDVFVKASHFTIPDNGRAITITTHTGSQLIIDRQEVVGLDFGFEEGTERPETPEEAEAQANMVKWTVALDALRKAASESKDKAVVAAFRELVDLEKAAEERENAGQGAPADDGQAGGGNGDA